MTCCLLTKRLFGIICVSLALVPVVAFPVAAHMTIMPRQSTAGIGEKYTIRVPAEGTVATTGAELRVPDGVRVFNVQAPINWTQEIEREGSRIVGIAWTMDLQPGEFMEFSLIALNPRDQSEIVWTLRQHYADGSTDDWTNGPKGIEPGAVTKLAPLKSE